MSLHRLVFAAACAFGTMSVQAADFPLTLHADDDSRWYDFFIGHFGELARTANGSPAPNVMYAISAEPNPLTPTVYQPTGGNAVLFREGALWQDAGTLTYNGSGNGTFPVTGLTLDLSPFVDIRQASAMGNLYRTELSNVSGISMAGDGNGWARSSTANASASSVS